MTGGFFFFSCFVAALIGGMVGGLIVGLALIDREEKKADKWN